VNPGDVTSVLAAADVFLLASRREGRPNALVEAAAAGLACVATDCGGVRDVLGDNGLVVPVDDENAFANEIARLWNDPARRETVGRSTRERAFSGIFSWSAHVDRLESVYGNLMKAHT